MIIMLANQAQNRVYSNEIQKIILMFDCIFNFKPEISTQEVKTTHQA